MSKNSLLSMYGRFYVYRYTSEYFKGNGGKGGISSYLNSHYSLLLLLANKYKVHNIAELEAKYNTLTQQEANFLKTLTPQIKEDKDILTKMLQAFISEDLTQEQLQDLVNNLVWDESLQAFQYRGTSYSKNASKDKDINTSIGKATEYRIPSAVVKRLDKIISKINSSEKYVKEQKNTFISSLKKLKTQVMEYGRIREKKEQVGDNIERVTYTGKRVTLNSGEEKWQQDFSKWAYSEVRAILKQAMDIDNLNKTLSWKFTELLGHFVGNRVSDAKKEVITVIEDWVKHGVGHQKTSASRGMIEWDMYPELFDQDYLASAYNKKDKYVANVKGVGYTLTPVVQDNAKLDGKTDATFTVTYDDGKKETVNLSIKNYNLTSDLNASNIQDLSVKLQGTSRLLLYLEGAESIHRKFTLHMLNLLSDHEEHPKDNQSVNLENLREQALEVLKCELMYSALTGAAQMKAGLQANVFAIYDKGATTSKTPRIKLFDMGTIIEEAIANSDSIVVKELNKYSSSNPMFKNTTENPEVTSASEKEAAAKLRVTKIMHEARAKGISVGLSKQLLNNIYNQRG